LVGVDPLMDMLVGLELHWSILFCMGKKSDFSDGLCRWLLPEMGFTMAVSLILFS
jgi:hypothetical protein